MHTFADQNGYTVKMELMKNAFGQQPSHVFILCRYGHVWVLTKHKERGIECPGGKVEPGETLEEAACREAYEETGARLGKLHFIGEYKVEDPVRPFSKAVFFSEARCLDETKKYFETDGPYLEPGDLLAARFQEEYSFLMKDDVIDIAVKEVRRRGLL